MRRRSTLTASAEIVVFSQEASGGGLTLFFEEFRDGAVRRVDDRKTQVEQEVDNFGAGDEVTRPKAFECLVDRHHQVGRHGRFVGHAAPFEWNTERTRPGLPNMVKFRVGRVNTPG